MKSRLRMAGLLSKRAIRAPEP